jgi:hypothetical protein
MDDPIEDVIPEAGEGEKTDQRSKENEERKQRRHKEIGHLRGPTRTVVLLDLFPNLSTKLAERNSGLRAKRSFPLSIPMR